MNRPRSRAYYFACVPLVSVIISLAFLSAIFVATDVFNAEEWKLGLLGAAVTGTYALLCPILGRLIGHVDPKPKVIAVCLMYVAVGSVAPQLRSLWLLLALLGLLGLAGAIYWPMIESVVCEGCTRAQMRRNLGTFNVLWCGGVTCGTILAGPLYDVSAYWPFYVAAAIAVALLILFIVIPSPRGTQEEVDAASSSDHEEKEVPREVANSFLYLSKVLVFLAYFTYGCLRSLFPKYGAQMGLSATAVSFLLFVAVGGQTVTFLLFRNTGFWHYRFWPLLATTAAAAAAFFVVGSAADVPAFIVPFLCIGLFLGCSYFSSIYYSMARPGAGAESAAWHEMTLGTGSTLGPIVGGLFAMHTESITAPFVLSGVVAVIGLGITVQFFLRRFGRAGQSDGKDAQLQ